MTVVYFAIFFATVVDKIPSKEDFKFSENSHKQQIISVKSSNPAVLPSWRPQPVPTFYVSTLRNKPSVEIFIWLRIMLGFRDYFLKTLKTFVISVYKKFRLT